MYPPLAGPIEVPRYLEVLPFSLAAKHGTITDQAVQPPPPVIDVQPERRENSRLSTEDFIYLFTSFRL